MTTPSTSDQLYTPPDVAEASEAYGVTCGPAALAAVLGLPCMALRRHLGDFETRGSYMNPTHMKAALASVGALAVPIFPAKVFPPPERPELAWPTYGLLFVQFEGPWTKPGVPVHVAYRHTHWVGCAETEEHGVMLYDINVHYPAHDRYGGWMVRRAWEQGVVSAITETIPKASGGWYVRWACAVARPKEVEHGAP